LFIPSVYTFKSRKCVIIPDLFEVLSMLKIFLGRGDKCDAKGGAFGACEVRERKPRVVGVPLAFPFAYKLIRVSISKGVSIYLSVHYWSGLS
jgi:hypothetical protein